jgi:hypothetical protein
MQLGSKETENERFAHYLTKTYRKTASLIANSVKAVRTRGVTRIGLKAFRCWMFVNDGNKSESKPTFMKTLRAVNYFKI